MKSTWNRLFLAIFALLAIVVASSADKSVSLASADNSTSPKEEEKSEIKWSKIVILIVVILLCLFVPVAITCLLASPAESLKKLTVSEQKKMQAIASDLPQEKEVLPFKSKSKISQASTGSSTMKTLKWRSAKS